MAHILSVKTRPTTQTAVVKDDTGVESTVEKIVDLVHEVTFMLDKDTPHTLTFHPAGTDVRTSEDNPPNIVGEQSPLYEFEDAAEAVAAFLDGRIR